MITTEGNDTIEAVRENLFKKLVDAAAVSMNDQKVTVSGINKPKLKRELMHDQVTLEALTQAVWIANGYRMTPHYWHMKAIEAAKGD